LTDLPFEAAGIAGDGSRACLGRPSRQQLWLAGTIPIEFFFEGRIARRRVPRCGC
jgi:hypothetical protein